MKIRSEIVWAILLIVTAAISFYLGSMRGALKSEKDRETTTEERIEKITILEDKVQQLSEELTSRGIFSYPQANIIAPKGNSAAKVLIVLNGKEPIQNLEVEKYLRTDSAVDVHENHKLKRGKGTTLHIGTLGAHNPVAFEIEKFTNRISMELIFKSENDQWHQYINTRKTRNGEIKSFWVITNRDSEVIDKHIDEGYPTDNGELVINGNRKMKYSDIAMNSIFEP